MMDIYKITTIIIFLLFYSFLLGWGLFFKKANKELFSWNINRIKRTLLITIGCMLYGLIYLLLPYAAIPFGFLAVVLLFYTSKYLGLVAYIGAVLLDGIVNQFNVFELIVLIAIGLIAYVLFSDFTKKINASTLVFAYLCADFVIYFVIYLSHEFVLTIGDFVLYSLIRIVIQLIILNVFLKYVLEYVVFAEDNYYDNISEPDSVLLMQLKDIHDESYFHAIHTAYLSEKIAKKICANSSLAKALGAYHRIGKIQGEDTIQNTLMVLSAYKFPIPFQEKMKEYGIKNYSYVSKEAAIVQIVDTFVSSITFLFKKDNKADLDYDRIIDVIIKKKFECNDFCDCELTLDELYQIKTGLVEEKKYYDFLRRK